MISRRDTLGYASGAALLTAAGCGTSSTDRSPRPARTTTQLLDDLEQRTFAFFWDTTNPANGLAPDRWPTRSFASVAAVGFALTAVPIGVERGDITREHARARVLATLRFLHDAPQGPEPTGRSGCKGFFYHFLDMTTGARWAADVELSTQDTALLLAGVLFCGAWFDRADAREAEIRSLAEAIYARVDWRWAQARPPGISLGWYPEKGFHPLDWKGYNEGMLVYLLALGSPTFPVDASAWDVWTSTYDSRWSTQYGHTYLHYHPLFVHQFTHCWIDFRGLADAWLRGKGIDYFENSRRATYAQQAYAIANPEGWAGYGRDVWGITACDGPADVQREYGGRMRRFISYAGRGMGGASTYDDGTIAPYGAGASIAFAPEIVIPTLAAMRERFGAHIYDRYGFHSFNRSFHFTDVTLAGGRVVPGFGWVDGDYVGIEQGPLLAMLSNHRGEIVWNAMKRVPHIRRGLQRAGFSGGWLGS